MIGDLAAVPVGGPSGFGHGRYAAAPRVGLDPVETALGDQPLEVFEPGLRFSGSDGHRTLRGQCGITLDVVRMQRLFDPEGPVLGELPGPGERGLPVPHLAGVDEYVHLVARAPPGLPH